MIGAIEIVFYQSHIIIEMHKSCHMQKGGINMKEDEIRPKEIFDKFLELAREDAITFFSNKNEFEYVDCPACEKNDSTFEFEKSGFRYELCKNCGTLYVNPRPKSENIKKYYEHSKSTKYWAEHFYKDTEAQRREKIFKPRAEMIRDFVKREIGGKVDVFADIGAGYGGFLEEARNLNIAEKIIAIEPSDDLARICENKSFDVIQSSLEESTDTLQHRVSLATSFELFEHLHSPKEFLDGVRNILADGGYFIFTTLNINGFDLQVLWEQSNSISPPHHLNFFNLESVEHLLKKCGFRILEKTTPGFLDVDIVKNAHKEGNIKLEDRFVRYLIENTDDSTQGMFQQFLRDNNLSSHMCIIAQRD